MAAASAGTPLPLTGDADADALLAADPLALLIGMLLDQQVANKGLNSMPMESDR